MKVAFIGGTGFYEASFLKDPQEVIVSTPYGEVKTLQGKHGDKEIFFITRHGKGHALPPHLVNYRANIACLKRLGTKAILASAAVGSLNMDMEPGHLVILDQFLDFTKGRPSTFFDGGKMPVVHTDMSYPYCDFLRETLLKAGKSLNLSIHPSGTYVCTEGPRFESAAEIKMFRSLGAHVVGMTGVPEVVLAREAGICYASVALVTNYAAGISPTLLTHEEVVEMMKLNAQNFIKLLLKTVEMLPQEWQCSCEKRPEAELILRD